MEDIITPNDLYLSACTDGQAEFLAFLDDYRRQERADAWNEGVIDAINFVEPRNPYIKEDAQ